MTGFEMPPREKTTSLSSKHRIPLRRKIAFTLLTLAMVLVCCEGLLRVRAWIRYGRVTSQGTRPMYVYDQNLLITIPRAGYEVVGTRVNVKINSLGFRGEEISQKKPSGAIRIVCTGASTTFCEEATSNDTTWPAQLQKRLRARYPDQNIEVINAGITGSAIISSLRDIRGRLLGLEPDLVILYRANNDIVLNTRKLAMDRGLVASKFSRQSGMMATLAKFSILAHLIRTNIDLIIRPHQETLDSIPPELPERFIRILGKIDDELKKENIPLLLSTFQVKFRPEQSRETQIANSRLAFYHMPWASMEDLTAVFETYNKAIVDFATSRSILVLTDTDSIPADDTHFADYMHLTDAGCEAMAVRFAKFMEQTRCIESIIAKRASTAP
jgi:lysophospholipase L1-like esterase